MKWKDVCATLQSERVGKENIVVEQSFIIIEKVVMPSLVEWQEIMRMSLNDDAESEVKEEKDTATVTK